jgi:glycosyltransferase involved in cell wall biosynthesis
MENRQLTCIIPIGPNHLDNKNLINSIKRDSGLTNFILVFDSTPMHLKTELNQLARINNRISTIEVSVQSPGGSRNAGMAQCQTDWIAFFDSDDFFDTRKVTKYLQECNGTPDAIIFGFNIYGHPMHNDNRLIDDTSCEINFHNQLEIVRSPGIWRWIFRYEEIKDIKFRDFRMGEDIVFLIDFLRVQRCIYFCSELLYNYVVGNLGQLTRDRVAKQELLRSLECCLSKLHEKSTPISHAQIKIDLTSLIFYSCLIHLNLKNKSRAIVRLMSFAIKSKGNARLASMVISSRFRVVRAT